MHDVVKASGVALIIAGVCALLAPSRPVLAQSKSLSKNQRQGKPNATGARTVLKSERDYLVGPGESPLVAGAKVELVFQNGKRQDGLEITDVQPGMAEGTLRTFSVKSRGKRQKIRPETLARVAVGLKSRPFEVLLDADSKEYVLLDLGRRDEVVAERLRTKGQRLWSGPGRGDEYRFVAEYKRDYLDKVQAVFADQAFQLHETQYFLFYTNLSSDQAEGFVADLDRMYVELGKLFGLLQETNVWRGKCVVLAFAEKSEFEKCDVQVMGRAPGAAATSQGLCHPFADGKVVVTCFKGRDSNFFRSLLVHETTHGFVAATDTSDPILSRIAAFTDLEELDLHNSDATDAGLMHLTGLRNLTGIDLSSTQVTDAGVAHLGRLKRLRDLDLSFTPVTDAGLSHLEGLTNLTSIWLDHTRG